MRSGWKAGEIVPPVLSLSAQWCPGYTFTSQHTSSLPEVHFHRLSQSPKWSAWKPLQQSAWQEYSYTHQRVIQGQYVHCTNKVLFEKVSVTTSFSLAEDSMNAAPQESASFFPSSGLITLKKKRRLELDSNELVHNASSVTERNTNVYWGAREEFFPYMLHTIFNTLFSRVNSGTSNTTEI